MRAYDALRRRGDFQRVHQRGRRVAGTHLICLWTPGRERTRVGITAAAKVGGAVERNRLRRRVKAVLDRLALGSPPFRDIVFIARPGAAAAPFPTLAAEVEHAVRSSA